MCATEKLGVLNRVIRLCVPQATEWQHIGNQVNAAMITARSDFVNVGRRLHRYWTFNHFVVAVWSAKGQNPRT